MAKRKKKRGTNFGARTGGASSEQYRQRERSRVGIYMLAGFAAIFVFCLVVWLMGGGTGSGGGDTTDAVPNDATIEAETAELEALADEIADPDPVDDAVEDSGFSADSEVIEDEVVEDDGFTASEEAVVEEDVAVDASADIDLDDFSFLPGDFTLTDLEPADRLGYYSEMPATVIDTSNTYDAIIVTERGDMRIRLYDDLAPVTVNNFVALALDGFYDNTTFHRVLEDFMVQAGDPTGTGTGGPGYQFEDETDTGLSFDRRGLLAMANAGPGTNGSQFFITHVATPWLDGNHTIFGEVIEGDDVLAAIRLRDPGRDPEPGDLVETIEIYVAE